MADGRLRQQWNQTSHLMAAMVNAMGGVDGRGVGPDEMNPYLAARRPKPRGLTDPRLLLAGFDDLMQLHVVQ